MITRRNILKGMALSPLLKLKPEEVVGEETPKLRICDGYPIGPGEELICEKATAQHIYITVKNKTTGVETTRTFQHPDRSLRGIRAHWKQQIYRIKTARKIRTYFGHKSLMLNNGDELSRCEAARQLKEARSMLRELES